MNWCSSSSQASLLLPGTDCKDRKDPGQGLGPVPPLIPLNLNHSPAADQDVVEPPSLREIPEKWTVSAHERPDAEDRLSE